MAQRHKKGEHRSLMDPQETLIATTWLLSTASVFTAAELCVTRGEFSTGGLLDARVFVQGTRWSTSYSFIFAAVAVAQGLLAIGAGGLLVVGQSPAIPLTLLAAVAVLQTQLLTYGRDGSDDMALVITVAVAIAHLSSSDLVLQSALIFIAAQLCLSYLASGVAKLLGKPWRTGGALLAILKTESYGNARVSRWLDNHSLLARWINWIVVFGELALPFGVLIGGWVAWFVLASGAVFHIMIAGLIGLNRFTPWFLSAYPATAWVAARYGFLG